MRIYVTTSTLAAGEKVPVVRRIYRPRFWRPLKRRVFDRWVMSYMAAFERERTRS